MKCNYTKLLKSSKLSYIIIKFSVLTFGWLQENYLNSHKEVLSKLRESRNKVNKEGVRGLQNSATSSDISFWIDKNSGEVLSHDVVNQKDFKTSLPFIKSISERNKTYIQKPTYIFWRLWSNPT